MNHTSIASQSQDPVHVQSKIDDFFGRSKIALTGWADCRFQIVQVSDYSQKGQIISKPFFLE